MITSCGGQKALPQSRFITSRHLRAFKLPCLGLSPGDQGCGSLHHHKPRISARAGVFLQGERRHGLGFLWHTKREQRFRRVAPRFRTSKRPGGSDIGRS